MNPESPSPSPQNRDPIHRDEAHVRLAQETLAILNSGRYVNSHGIEVVLQPAQEYAVSHTALYTPDQAEQLLSPQKQITEGALPTITVTDEPTQAAARRLAVSEGNEDLMVLNFASARKPGGGFLNGAPAQEESIARCCGLYPALLTQPDYYSKNRSNGSRLYTDHIIYSPKVPWFRDEQYRLLDDYYLASIITAPAPNAGSVHGKEKNKIAETLRRRAGKILAVAEANKNRSLLLGAWGCGVFKNDPNMVAGAFGDWLQSPRFKGSFDDVTFAVYDKSPYQHVLKAFQGRFNR